MQPRLPSRSAIKQQLIYNYHLSFPIPNNKSIAEIRHLITFDAHKTIIQGFVLSKLDYFNSLLVGSTKLQLEKFQHTLKMAGRIIYKLDKYDHVAKHMQQLHWILYPERINYKMALLMFKY